MDRGGLGVKSLTVTVRLSQCLQSAKEIHQFNHDVDELKGWMAEKEAVLDSEEQQHDLQSIQTLLRQHEALEAGDGQIIPHNKVSDIKVTCG